MRSQERLCGNCHYSYICFVLYKSWSSSQRQSIISHILNSWLFYIKSNYGNVIQWEKLKYAFAIQSLGKHLYLVPKERYFGGGDQLGQVNICTVLYNSDFQSILYLLISYFSPYNMVRKVLFIIPILQRTRRLSNLAHMKQTLLVQLQLGSRSCESKSSAPLNQHKATQMLQGRGL